MIALTHAPSPHLERGLRTHIGACYIDYALACQQHAAYCRVLAECGADVHTLTVNRDLPDSVFIEDTAVVLDELAVLTPMGTTARRPELSGIEPALGRYRPVLRVDPPAKLEGGDVLRLGWWLLVGISARTDLAGITMLEALLLERGYRVKPVHVTRCLHLKTACTALPDGVLLVNPAWLDMQALGARRQCLPIPADEPWGANVLTIGDRIIAAAEHEQTVELLRQRGYDVRTTPLSEFAKAEGGVTCLSLLFT